MAKKGMKRPGYTGPEAQNQSTAPSPQSSTGKEPKNKRDPGQSF